MKSLFARRRHPAAAVVVLLLALVVTGGLYTVFAPVGRAAATASSASDIQAGRALFITGCSTCHGMNAEGSSSGPSLVGVGAASVDFQVGTGRMPLQQQGPQGAQKPPIYTQDQVSQLAAYIASLGPGPAIPDPNNYDPKAAPGADPVSAGGELFRTNCAMCHNAQGAGGALTQGKQAPPLAGVDPKYMYEAMLTGPQNMPQFNDQVMPPAQKQQIIAYITNTTSSPNVGGLGLGRIGPVSEGLVLWVFGIGVLIVCSCWIAARTSKAKNR